MGIPRFNTKCKRAKGYKDIFSQNIGNLGDTLFPDELIKNGNPRKPKIPYIFKDMGNSPHFNQGIRTLSEEERVEQEKDRLFHHVTRGAREGRHRG